MARISIKANTSVSPPNAAREIIYEEVRKEHYPYRPSRFDSIFLCPNLETAKLFGERHRKDATLYEVEIIDTAAKQFIANWNMMAPKTCSYSDVITYAHDYWKGIDVPTEFQEIVIESDVQIVRKMKI